MEVKWGYIYSLDDLGQVNLKNVDKHDVLSQYQEPFQVSTPLTLKSPLHPTGDNNTR